MIAAENYRCWIIDYLPGEPDDETPHFPDQVDADEEFARLRKENEERYALAVIRQLDAPCWTVQCDGECEYTLDEDEDGLIHFESAAEAEREVRDCEWRLVPDPLSAVTVLAYCPEDAPEGGKIPSPSPEQQEAAGQMRLPGVA